jgi:erythrin-vacuolar iron transport family protein
MKNFSDLTEQELLALAISLEEEDSRIYDEFAHELDENYPDTAAMFRAMAGEENGHRHRLLNLYRQQFGEHIPLIRRQDVKGFVARNPVWLSSPLGLDKIREQAEVIEAETKRFYTRTALLSQDASVRQLLGDLAAEERRHEAKAERLQATYVAAEVRETAGPGGSYGVLFPGV